MISLIIPVYNTELYLSNCLDSILQQEFNDFEVIIVDDGSTDTSGKICDDYSNKDGRITVIHKGNGGVSSARNIGLEHARGEYIAFIDSDDWISTDYCKVISEQCKDVDLLFFQSSHHYSDGCISYNIPPIGFYNKQDDIQKILAILLVNGSRYQFFGYTWNKVFRRDIINRYSIRFSEELSVKEDELFTLQYSSYINSIRIIPHCIYNYRILGTGLTNKVKKAKDFYSLFKGEIELLHRFTESTLISTLYTLNFQYLSEALNLETKPQKQYSYLKEYKEYYHMNKERLNSPSIGIKESIILRISSICGLIALRIYSIILKKR